MNTNIGLTLADATAERMISTARSSPALPQTCGRNEKLVTGEADTRGKRKSGAKKRLAREWRTIELMVRIYCRDHHETELCPECQGLLDYASVRLDRCRFGAEKPTCAKCPVHCYQKERREQVRVVMRYAGPRMLWEHPILSLRHWVDGMRFRKS
jgi:hypothetical protein